MIAHSSRSDHITSILGSLHWLPVEQKKNKNNNNNKKNKKTNKQTKNKAKC